MYGPGALYKLFFGSEKMVCKHLSGLLISRASRVVASASRNATFIAPFHRRLPINLTPPRQLHLFLEIKTVCPLQVYATGSSHPLDLARRRRVTHCIRSAG
jgi:hypothetical protein